MATVRIRPDDTLHRLSIMAEYDDNDNVSLWRISFARATKRFGGFHQFDRDYRGDRSDGWELWRDATDGQVVDVIVAAQAEYHRLIALEGG